MTVTVSPDAPIVPIYLVVDVSASMFREIPAVNDAIASVVDYLRNDPLLMDRIRLSVITFSSQAETVLPMTSVEEIQSPPKVELGGGTSYNAPLRVLLARIPADIDALKRSGYRVARPIVFFLSDGMPDDGSWQRSLDVLNDNRYRPVFLAFGIGMADPSVLAQLASRPGMAFMAQQRLDADRAIGAFGQAIRGYLHGLSVSTANNSTSVDFAVAAGFSVIPHTDSWG
jgi:uncharacterized protein YegL